MIETKFKPSELGLIPEDWEVAKISDFTDVVTGATPSTENADYWGGHILWMSSGELNNKIIHDVVGRITNEGFNAASTHMLPTNCVLIGLAGQGKTRGTAAINKVELCTNQSIGAILPSNRVDADYLYLYMDSQYKQLRELSSGDGGRGGLTKTLLLNLQVCFPSSTKEQEKIAESLSDIDSLIKELDCLIEKKRNVMQGTMQDLLTARRRLPGYNKPWTVQKLGDISSPIMGQSPSSQFYNVNGDGLPLIQGNADIRNRRSFIRTYSSQYSKSCSKGDIIMSVRAPVGEIAIASFDSCLGRGVCSFTKNLFLYYVLIFNEPNWKIISAGSTFESVNGTQINDFPILMPCSLDEQNAISNILSDMETEIGELEAKRDKYVAIRQGMMQQLLTGKIRLI